MKRGIFIVGFGVSILMLLFSQVMAQGGRIRFNNLTVIPGITLSRKSMMITYTWVMETIILPRSKSLI